MAPRPEPVTNDWMVAHAMAYDGETATQELGWFSKEVATMLGLDVFQITARLKAMEKRGLVLQVAQPGQGPLWVLTENGYYLGIGKEPAPKPKVPLGERVYRTPTGGYYSPGGAGRALVDDSGAIRLQPEDTKGWRMRYVYEPRNKKGEIQDGTIEVFIDLEGGEWVRAEADEEAHVLCHHRWEGLRPTRLRKMDGSSRAEVTIRSWERRRNEDLQWSRRNEGRMTYQEE